MARHDVGDRIERGIEHADCRRIRIGAGMADHLGDRHMIRVAARGRQRDGDRPGVAPQAVEQIGAGPHGVRRAHHEGDVFGVENGERREAGGIGFGHPHQKIRRHVGRADAHHMGIPRMPIDMGPGLAAAVAAHIDHRDRHVDQAVRLDRLGERARRTVEPAARRRAGDQLEGALGFPAQFASAGLAAPSTRFHRSTSLRMKVSNQAGERCAGGTMS